MIIRMIYYFLLAFSILLTVCKSSVYNAYAKRVKPSLFGTFAFNALTYGCAAAIALIALLFDEMSLSLPTVVCAVFYAAIVFSLQTISVTAMKHGAMSLTAICVMYGMIIPSLAGPIFWKEAFGVLQAIGIVLMLASLWLLRGKSREKSKTTVTWVLLAIFAFVLSGMAGLMEKIHQSTEGREEKSMFVFVACLAMLAFSIVAGLMAYGKNQKVAGSKLFWAFGGLTGLIVGAYSIINLTLAGGLDSMIYYPVANGGAMLLTVLVSCAVFKEPLDLCKIIGTVIGLGGIVCLSIPI